LNGIQAVLGTSMCGRILTSDKPFPTPINGLVALLVPAVGMKNAFF
jgi:hypothetical protein